MPLRPEWAKSPVATYIYKHLKQKTRYEIDLALLQAGHSPEEIEEAWQLVNPPPTDPILVTVRRLDLLILLGSLFLTAFTFLSFFLNVWPLMLYLPLVYLLISVVTLSGTIALFKWGKARIAANIKASMVNFWGRFLFLELAVLTLVLGLASLTDIKNEVASISVESQDYHLIHSSNIIDCINRCNYELLTLYQCENHKFFCPETASIGINDWSGNGLQIDTTKVSLKYESATGKLLLLEGDRVVYTLKKL